MVGHSYSAIPEVDEEVVDKAIASHFEVEGSETQKQSVTNYLKNPALIKFFLVVGVVLSAIYLFTSRNTSAPTVLGSCRSCSFLECKRTLCDVKLDPYICVKGAAMDGCAPNEAAWVESSTCTECCDAAKCASTLPVEGKDNIAMCGPCSDEECITYGYACGYLSSYVCTDGSARYGCSDDKYHWPTALNGICNKCCDIRKC